MNSNWNDELVSFSDWIPIGTNTIQLNVLINLSSCSSAPWDVLRDIKKPLMNFIRPIPH